MKVLLTGYTGLLGRHIAKQLKDNGYWLRVLLHAKAITKKELENEVDDHIFGAMDDPNVIKKALKDVDCVIHSGWKFNPNNVEHPTINEKAIRLLLNESKKCGVKKFAFLSSIAVYGMIKNKVKFDEASNLASGEDLRFIYPKEKIIVENILRENYNDSMLISIFRPGPIFDEKNGPATKELQLMGKTFGLGFGNGRNLMPNIHADDVASAILLWIQNSNSNEIFNLIPNEEIKYKEWIKLYGKARGIKIIPFFIRSYVLRILATMLTILKKVLGKPGKVDVSYAIASSTRNLKYSSEKAQQILGWEYHSTQRYINQKS
jgi:nucleoside-diphosphate-sugar epimerase